MNYQNKNLTTDPEIVGDVVSGRRLLNASVSKIFEIALARCVLTWNLRKTTST